MDLRLVDPNDELFLRELYASTRAAELDAWGWEGAQRRSFLALQFDAQQKSYAAQYPHSEHLLISERGSAIGRMIVCWSNTECRLVDIAFLPEYRDQGRGTTLITDLLRQAGVSEKPVRLSVQKSNPAIRLYRRLGFRTLEDDGVYVQMEVEHSKPAS